MSEILSGARKYGMGPVLAHQDLRQLDRDKEVASAVLSNAYTRVGFGVGDSETRTLSEGFAHFPASELQNLPVGDAICRIGQSFPEFEILDGQLRLDASVEGSKYFFWSIKPRLVLPRP